MKLVRKIIKEHEAEFENFQYYYTIIDIIESNIADNPDISIESCKSLFEGVSKTILLKLDQTTNIKELEDLNVQQVVKKALSKMKEFTGLEELNYITVFAKEIGTLRSFRGDISHGRPSPKELQSESIFAEMIMNVTDSFMHYILRLFFNLDIHDLEIYEYDAYPEFNDWLDDQDSAGFFKSYSLTLYQTDYIRYEQELLNYYPELELNETE